MEKQKKRMILKEQYLSFVIKGMLILIPAVIGYFGVKIADGGGFLQTAYKTAQLFLMEYNIDNPVMNPALEAARWLAPIATLAVILSFLYSMVENIGIWWKTSFRDIVAIHGDSANIDLVLQNLAPDAIHSDKKMAFRARRHILMFEDDFDMYHFLDEHGSKIVHDKEKQIYLCSEKILRGSYENKQLVVCNIAENCARDYWDKYPITNSREKVLIIGFQNYGQRILTQAIMKNVVDVDTAIEYHVVGDYHDYLSVHQKINKAVHVKIMDPEVSKTEYQTYGRREEICGNEDTVFFYNNMKWFDVMNLTYPGEDGRKIEFDRIILVDDIEARNMDILNELKTYYVVPKCYVKFTDKKILDTLWNVETEQLVPFGVNEELYEPEIILKEKLFEDAKVLHARYFANWLCSENTGEKCCDRVRDEHGVCPKNCLGCQKFKDDWASLSTFIRYSNVASADHMKEKLRLVLGDNVDLKEPGIGKKAVEKYHQIPLQRKQELWKIEHMRWDRYHFMNNWDYDPVRQNEKRLHHLLVPFEELAPKQQSKDEDAYLALADVFLGENKKKGKKAGEKPVKEKKYRRYDFTKIIDRKGQDALAVDQIPYENLTIKEGFDMIPMWVADMNFATVPTVEEAISDRLKHPCFGYFAPREEYFSSIINWQQVRHGVEGLTADCIGYENGVLGGVMSAVYALCEGKEKILLHAPTYVGFTKVLENNGYPIVHSYLKQDDKGVWRMDYEDMEQKIRDEGIRVAILCSPHNPCGRVWERWELEKAMELYKKYDVRVISDEIWSDIVMKGHKHIPTQMISEDAKMRTIALYAPSKTFNLAGLIGSYHIIYNEELRKNVRKEASLGHYNNMNVLSMYALIGAYKPKGQEWVNELCDVIGDNINYACDFIAKNFEGVSLMKPEGTYMLFLDCEEWCRAHNKTLDELLLAGAEVGVIWQDGRPFHGKYSIRVNLALPTSGVEEAFGRLKKYVF